MHLIQKCLDGLHINYNIKIMIYRTVCQVSSSDTHGRTNISRIPTAEPLSFISGWLHVMWHLYQSWVSDVGQVWTHLRYIKIWTFYFCFHGMIRFHQSVVSVVFKTKQNKSQNMMKAIVFVNYNYNYKYFIALKQHVP
jgi:hypothetical protein